jgi:hypothetical protein
MNDRVYGGNWDARQIYVWDRSGRLLEKRDNRSGNAYQDMKSLAGQLVGGGIRPMEAPSTGWTREICASSAGFGQARPIAASS